MNKATLVLVTLAALAIGALVGVSLSDKDADSSHPQQAVSESTDAESANGPASNGGAPVFRYLSPATATVEVGEFGRPMPSAVGENYIGRSQAWKTQTVSFELPEDGKVEYKVVMNQGDTIVYNWKVDDGIAYFDFHAHDDAFGKEFFTRYAEGEEAGSSGAIVAAYTGQHGWFWLNLEDKPIMITLEVAGFFDKIIEIDLEDY